MKIYVTIDFETINSSNDEWSGVCVLVSNYPEGKVLDCFETYCEHDIKHYDDKTLKFWQRNTDSHVHNIKRGIGLKKFDEEKKLCLFIETIKKQYPNFYLDLIIQYLIYVSSIIFY